MISSQYIRASSGPKHQECQRRADVGLDQAYQEPEHAHDQRDDEQDADQDRDDHPPKHQEVDPRVVGLVAADFEQLEATGVARQHSARRRSASAGRAAVGAEVGVGLQLAAAAGAESRFRHPTGASP
jgi:hypothetical protein